MLEPVRFFGALATGAFAVLLLSRFVTLPSKLAVRVRPYTAVSRSNLGRSPDVLAVSASATIAGNEGFALQRMVRPLLITLEQRVSRVLGSRSHQTLQLKLRQADMMSDIPEAQRVHEYRVRQLGMILGGAFVGTFVPLALTQSPQLAFIFMILGSLIAGAQLPAKLGKTIEQRQARMRIELYTINQQLALHLRTGGSPMQAIQRIVARGQGEVVSELAEVVRLHTRGLSTSKALSRAAELTPEPFAARTYKLLASGAERGSDLASGLIALSDDVRDARRDALRQAATKRRAQMLVPIVGIMAPLMILFLAAPLPSMIFKARGG